MATTNFLSRVKDSLSRSFNGEPDDENPVQETESVHLEVSNAQVATANPSKKKVQEPKQKESSTKPKLQIPIEEPVVSEVEEEEVVITSDAPLRENVRRERSVGTWNRVELPTPRALAIEDEVAVAQHEAMPLDSPLSADAAFIETETTVAHNETPSDLQITTDNGSFDSSPDTEVAITANEESEAVPLPVWEEVYGNEVLNNSGVEQVKPLSGSASDLPLVDSIIPSGENLGEDVTKDTGMVTPVQDVYVAEADEEPLEASVNLSDVAQLLLLEIPMATLNESLNNLMKIDGAMAVALVDSSSGMSMGTAGGGPLDLDVAAAGNSEVVKAKLKVMKNLALDDKIEDILITLGEQYHLIRPLKSAPEVFVYLVLNRSSANLAMARHKLAASEKDLEI